MGFESLEQQLAFDIKMVLLKSKSFPKLRKSEEGRRDRIAEQVARRLVEKYDLTPKPPKNLNM